MKDIFYLYLIVLITYIAVFPESYGAWKNAVDEAYFESLDIEYME